MTLETLTKCPVCNAGHFSAFLHVKDYTVSGNLFQIVKCDSCNFLFTNPRPPESEIGAFYDSAEYISHHDEAKDLMSRLYTAVRNFTTQQKIKLLDRLVSPKGALLDVGCGTGFFISKAMEAGWHVAGTEPDTNARAQAAGRVGEGIKEGIRDSFFETKKFDVITMWHVLEHVHLLNETMKWLHDHLKENGRLIIAVPNPESYDAQKFKDKWAAYDVPRHLYHFSKHSLEKLAQVHQFKVQEVLPMWFDSYYVSMLSSRYKNGQTNLPESIWSGTVSNLKGRNSSQRTPNTSSLIYVLSKA
ncbi:class I SAM-dependent methyltransferase [Arundinibacter roseus]|uniref:Class I SAM-dependent methyltransferase n=1 Tax=Arundinibacter roseus TaxID=2070510 RepID=A0A4V2X7V3_9BACT|nr:class I SAM-dependent methyltransferase [Arundinibacter roseus]TDB57345.1 class I SAM-dependent methyltransferase [Arundinibacter roseus]